MLLSWAEILTGNESGTEMDMYQEIADLSNKKFHAQFIYSPRGKINFMLLVRHSCYRFRMLAVVFSVLYGNVSAELESSPEPIVATQPYAEETHHDGSTRLSEDLFPTCHDPKSMIHSAGRVCFDVFKPSPLDTVPARRPKSACSYLDNVYHSIQSPDDVKPTTVVSHSTTTTPPPTMVTETLTASPFGHEMGPEERIFVKGEAYSASMTKLLVDHAANQSGGKILTQSDGIRGVSEILGADSTRYLLTLCTNKVWFTIRLSDDVFVERIGFVASELFASTFRHIQVLGSRQYPTNEWRVLGEVETNPVENQEWFDISASSECSKCYVRYIKIRVLSHHALEGYSNCALTRVQVFGSTVLQSLDRFQANRTEPDLPKRDEKPADEENTPLLKFIEEMTQLKKQYQSVASSVFAMNEIIKAQQKIIDHDGKTSLITPDFFSPTDPAGRVIIKTISIFDYKMTIRIPTEFDMTHIVLGLLVSYQVVAFLTKLIRRTTDVSEDSSKTPQSIVVSMHSSGERDDTGMYGSRRFSIRPQPTQFKKRHHGLWRPKIRKVWYQHHARIDDEKEQGTVKEEETKLPQTIHDDISSPY
jgi:hypothetical protein